MSDSVRSKKWSAEEAPGFWWHRLPGMNYEPAIYSDLSESEWAIVAEWFEETSRAGQVDEVSVPLMSFLHGLVLGNRAERIVQLGTHAGYSALLLGFMLRRMNARRGLFTIDIDPASLAAGRQWIRRAKLEDFVQVAEGDFLDPATVQAAKDYFGTAPELIILDNSHEYSATVRQLDLWYGAHAYGGMLVVHDVSRFSQNLDATKEGGVRRAFVEWRAAHPECESFLLNPNEESIDSPRPFYKDARGLGLIHKPRAK
ncbi:MAG: class I SAM-dependent methyltransferase [Verrucomicrobiota bacterium]|nr:class I SAM-dependent methyltransferase [Verrucomicrobiota bacterium]MDQ6940614.1 class I SAM-dependent methyltransferase [Verrucomicrobiota bacterium]